MATITSVNNTTPGATYNIHDTTTWIGGVVPGPNDTVVFQSATATTWFLTQSWTIQGITWSVSTNRSESGIEVPNTVSQDIIFTQTVTSWYNNSGTMPMVNSPTEFRTKPWLLVNNPVGTTFTLNLPGDLGYSTGDTGSYIANIDTVIIRCSQAGTAILNIAGAVRGHNYYQNGSTSNRKNAIFIGGSSGYSEVNCNSVIGGKSPYAASNSTIIYHNAILIATASIPNLAGFSFELNCSTIGINTGMPRPDQHAAAICIGQGSGCNLFNGVVLNVTGVINYSRATYGNIFSAHTSGTLTINATSIVDGSEPWSQGYNEDYTNSNGPTYYRRNVYLMGNASTAVTIFNCDIYGPNNIFNGTTAQNFSNVITGACTQYIYGNIYSSTLNRYQIPLYYDNDNALWYHMTGTAYVSINPIVWSARVAFLGFTGGFYHANVVQANDPTNVYSPNRCPFIVPTLTPNPNYTGGNQLTWTYIKGADNRAQTTTMINANYTGYSPAESNVRLGVVYGNGLRTGTCAVPLPSQVALGIGVDNTVGTWAGDINIIDQSSFADAVWNYDLTQVTNTTNGTGQRLLNNATIESTGDQIAALGV